MRLIHGIHQAQNNVSDDAKMNSSILLLSVKGPPLLMVGQVSVVYELLRLLLLMMLVLMLL